eukprot:scaffold42397_cov33-Tisochrysis_lutea.AAC.1
MHTRTHTHTDTNVYTHTHTLLAAGDSRIQNVVQNFQKLFGQPCDVLARAPGRVNVIGEHVDYSGGSVLPIAVGQ